MSKGTATALVLLTGAILATLTLLHRGSLDSAKTYKRLWAAGLLTVALGVAADFVPELVGPFAILIIVGAVAYDKGTLGNFIQSASTTQGG